MDSNPKGMRIDHSAVRLEFMNWVIKYKTKCIKKLVIYWKAIKETEDVNENLMST